MHVEIVRGLGNKRAPDIVDELCTTDACAIKRGQNFLDETGYDTIEYELEVAPLDDMPDPGALVGVQDASLGESFDGKITGYSISVQAQNTNAPLSVATTLYIERRLTDE